ncbi:MAG: serine/threonine-protein kinase [Polyangiaceae bacterium]
MSSAPDFPERVGRYSLLAPIGSGGLANVYLGRAQGVGGFTRQVAVKILHPHLREQRELMDQLIQEAKVVSQIRHPNVVQVLDVGEDTHGVFIVMDYVEGDSLATLLRWARSEGPALPRSIALRILADALDGLQAAHAARDEDGTSLGLVHRDFSPQNLMVGTDGVTRLIDFGVAKLARSAIQTRTGLIKGKVAYMAPEQTRGQPVDQRCDLWAAGVVIWETFAGRRLFRRGDDLSTMLEIASGEIPDLGSEPGDMPQGAVAATRAVLRRPPAERSASAAELKQLLLSGADAVAGCEEVALYVRTLAGPRLLERRERIGKIRELREQIRSLGTPADAATPSGPPLPVEATQPLAEHSDTHHSLSQGTATAPRSRRAAWIAGGLGVVAVGVGSLLWLGKSGSAAAPREADIAKPASTPLAGSTPEPAPQTSLVRISAAEPIAKLSVSGRDVPLAVAANLVDIRVESGTTRLVVQASTPDGRTTSYVSESVPPSVRLEFPAAPAAKKAAPRTTAHPAPAQTPGAQPRTLSPSPYRKTP